MKALEWHQFLDAQRTRHGKVVFTVTELANATNTSPRVLNVELSRLMKRGILMRYAHGRYGGTQGVAPEELLPFVDSCAYITGFYALHWHNLLTQVPSEITCFTCKRHNRSRRRISAAGRLVFTSVSPKVYAKPLRGVIAPPEQALCDFVYLMSRKSLDARQLVTFRNLDRLNARRLTHTLKRYPRTVVEVVTTVAQR